MKSFDDLNDTELLALTQDQIDHYIKIKKAETGIKLMVRPEVPTYQPVPDKDLDVYEVSGFFFKEREPAEEIASVINKHILNALKVTYDYYRGDTDYRYAAPYSGALENVSVSRIYSGPLYQTIKDTIASNKKIKEAYEEVEKAYDDEEEKAIEIVDAVYLAIREARERLEKFNNYKKHIVEYLTLANGDTAIAWNFFDKAYTVDETIKAAIMESEEYQTAIINVTA